MPKVMAIDCETTGPMIIHGCRAFMLAGCTDSGDLYCWKGRVDPLTREVHWKRKDIAEMIAVISAQDILVFHNGPFDLSAIQYISEKLYEVVISKDIDDTLVQSHIVNSSGSHGLKDLSLYHLDILDDDESELKKAVRESRALATSQFPDWLIAKNGLASLPNYRGDYAFCDYWLPEAIAIALGYDADHPWHNICQVYNERDVERTVLLHGKFNRYFSKYELEHVYAAHKPLVRVVKSIQDHGFHFFYDKAVDAVEQLQRDIFPYRKNIEAIAGIDFNIDSPKQMQAFLYDRFQLPVIAYTESGQPSCDANTLQRLSTDYGYLKEFEEAAYFLNNVLAIRVRNTTANYIKNYIAFAKDYLVHYNDGSIFKLYYLHPNLNQTGTSTVRFSCSQPNSQNISKGREEEDDHGGKERVFNLRELFGPPPGYHWCTIDYKSLQLIIFAYETGDQGLIDTFLSGGDPHNYVACGLFDTDHPTDLERRVGKNVNYALIFGAGDSTLDATAGKVGVKELYKKQFPSTDKYMQNVIKQARSRGYVTTAWGYPLTVSPDAAYKGVNYIIQGDEGEIVKRAMWLTYDYLRKDHPDCRLIMQIHDELIFEYPEWYDFPLDEIKRLMMKPAADIGWHTPVDASIIKEHWGKKE